MEHLGNEFTKIIPLEKALSVHLAKPHTCLSHWYVRCIERGMQ